MTNKTDQELADNLRTKYREFRAAFMIASEHGLKIDIKYFDEANGHGVCAITNIKEYGYLDYDIEIKKPNKDGERL